MLEMNRGKTQVARTVDRARHLIRRELLPLPRTDRDFVVRCYREILGRGPDRPGLRSKVLALQEGTVSRGDTALEMARSGEYVDRTAAAGLAGTEGLSDEDFVRHAYQVLMRREADPSGLRSYSRLLAEGRGREEVLRYLIASDEHVNRVAAAAYGLPDLRTVRPDAYEEHPERGGGTVLTFHARTPADYDWLEKQILDNGYYDKPGIWGSEINVDKRLVAEMAASLRPTRVLDFGCASGAMLVALDDAGILGEGIEISASAVARAEERVRGRIHVGDLMDVSLPEPYDVISGFDIYEHLNPNRLDAYIARVAELLAPGGFALCNIPAFGEDDVFGTVFPRYVPQWDAEAEQDRLFSLLPVDDEGYPHHGHLVWAESTWWVNRWERAGLRREPEIEAALHARYDAYLAEAAPARRSFYIFSRDGDPARSAELAKEIAATPSAALAEA